MKVEIIIALFVALLSGCFTLSVKYPRVCIDIFETLSRSLTQILMSLLFVFLGHAATRYLVSHKFETVFDGRVYSDSPEDELSKTLAEHAEFTLARMESAITSANDLFLQGLAIFAGANAALLLLFTSCTFLAKKIMEHGYSAPLPRVEDASEQIKDE